MNVTYHTCQYSGKPGMVPENPAQHTPIDMYGNCTTYVLSISSSRRNPSVPNLGRQQADFAEHDTLSDEFHHYSQVLKADHIGTRQVHEHDRN